MKRRISALILALSMLLTVPVLAAEDSMENFVRERTYTGQFADLTPGSVFYDNVAALYEYGLSVGKGDGTYGLQDSMTVSQIVIFAGRIRSLYRTGDAEAGPNAFAAAGDSLTATRYLRYLQSEGVLGTELDGVLAAPATRAQVAHVLANVLPAEALPPINTDLVTQGYASREYITDVTEYTPYYQDILTLYHTGVSMGSDESGSYLPDTLITRGAAAAMLTRMADPSLRITPSWEIRPHWSAHGQNLATVIEPGTYIAAPTTSEEMDQCIRYMLSRGEDTLHLQYDGAISAMQARRILDLSLQTVKTYCEQSYNNATTRYYSTGAMTISFSAASANGKLPEYRAFTSEAAVAVHDALWESGAITADMTQLQKARVYYTWIAENCVYDYSAGEDSISHIAYGLFHNGTAVCDGYTGAYNLLLKLEGISCTALSNSSHIWTVAELDGVTYHIDTTWGDSGSRIDYRYFAMTAAQSRSYHSW